MSVDFGGKADILRAFFFSDGDPTLVVRTPDGAFHCNDNTNQLILDPTVEITQPVTGRYDVWVGSKVATDLIPGFLGFHEPQRHGRVAARTCAASSSVRQHRRSSRYGTGL